LAEIDSHGGKSDALGFSGQIESGGGIGTRGRDLLSEFSSLLGDSTRKEVVEVIRLAGQSRNMGIVYKSSTNKADMHQKRASEFGNGKGTLEKWAVVQKYPGLVLRDPRH
jgi:hypothetical protein